MTLARQFLLLQVLIMLAVLVAVGAISIAQSARSFERTEARPALNAAENLAGRAVVRQAIGERRAAAAVRARRGGRVRPDVSGSTSALLAGDDGVVLVSSDPRQVGHAAGLGASHVLDGVALDRRAARRRATPSSWPQVPVYDVDGGVIGLAAIGRTVPSVWSRLGDVVPNLLVYLGVASVLGLGGSLLLSRRVKRQTLGMEPTEIAGLVEHREALVHGVKEGVVALDQDEPGHRGERQRTPAPAAARATVWAAGSTTSTSTRRSWRC